MTKKNLCKFRSQRPKNDIKTDKMVAAETRTLAAYEMTSRPDVVRSKSDPLTFPIHNQMLLIEFLTVLNSFLSIA